MAAPYTSEWWLQRLTRELDARAPSLRKYQMYYDGRQPLMLATKPYRDQFQIIFGSWSDNFVALCIQATEERLTIDGYRFGSPRGDKKAWSIWQSSEMDAQSQKAHREALLKSVCPVIVEPTNGMPKIRVQRPEEVIVAYSDDDPLVRAVALKRWHTETGQTMATLYYPDRVEKYQGVRTLAWRNQYGEAWDESGAWEQRRVTGETWPLKHKLGAVPVVELINDASIGNIGRSDVAGVLPLQDALNKLFMDLLVASEYGAFRQRWATGIEIPVDPTTGKPLEPFKPAVDRVWSTALTDAKFGDFEQTQLAGIINAIETTIQHIASTTRTPPHYLLGQMGAFPSGEALRSVETGLVAKARRRMRDFGEAWEEVMRLAFRALGDAKRGAAQDAETIWRDPENRTESQHVDALLKLGSLGVPEEQLWADAGYSPQDIERFRQIKLGEAAAERRAPAAPDVANPDGTPPAGMSVPIMATMATGGK